MVWLNEYFGEFITDGEVISKLNIPDEQALKVLGFVMVREYNRQTYGDDVREMLERRLTFDEAIQMAEFSLVSKQRLSIVRQDIFEQIDALSLR